MKVQIVRQARDGRPHVRVFDGRQTVRDYSVVRNHGGVHPGPSWHVTDGEGRWLRSDGSGYDSEADALAAATDAGLALMRELTEDHLRRLREGWR